MSFFKNKPFRLTVLTLALLFSSNAYGNNDRPDPTGTPTQVELFVAILDIDEIDGVSQSFFANVFIAARWKDKRLAHNLGKEVTYDLKNAWFPRLTILNEQKTFRSMPQILEVSSDGTVVYRQRLWGSFSQPLELQNFPFDIQNFAIKFATAGYSSEEVQLVLHKDRTSGIAESLSLPDWKVRDVEIKVGSEALIGGAEEIPTFTIQFEAERTSSYFVVKVILPLILIVCMSGVVYWLDPSMAATQISVSSTAMLTLIAYRFAIDGLVPKVSYLTRMDTFIFIATFIIFAGLIIAVTTSILAREDRLNMARQIDKWCRVLFVIGVSANIVYAFLI